MQIFYKHWQDIMLERTLTAELGDQLSNSGFVIVGVCDLEQVIQTFCIIIVG